MKLCYVVDGVEKIDRLSFVNLIGPGRYYVSGTNLLIFIDGIKSDGSPIIRYYLAAKHSNMRYDLTFEQFFDRLPDGIKEIAIYNMDAFS